MLRLLKISLLVALSMTFQAFTIPSGSGELVYICVTGKVYHSSNSCKGLNNATHEIKKVTKDYAVSIHRRPCKICY